MDSTRVNTIGKAPAVTEAVFSSNKKTMSKNNEFKPNDYSNITLDDLKEDFKNNNNPFPIEVFPTAIRDFILNAEDTLNFNRDYFSASILSALSLAIGNSFRLKIDEGWTPKCILWIALVGDSGDGKTPPLKEAFSPIDNKENELYELYKQELENFNQNQQGLKVPIAKRYIVRDFTIEALTEKLSQNPKGIGILADELLGWVKNMGKYNNGSDVEAYLELFNGGKITVDRVGRTIIIQDAFVNVIGGIQRDKLHEVFKKDFDANGFIFRILWVDPGQLPFVPENEMKLDIEHKKNYERFINKLFEERENPKNRHLILSAEAKKLRRQWWNEFGEKHHYDELYIKGTYRKIREYFNRFLVVFTILECVDFELQHEATKDKDNLQVTKASVEKSITLAEYFFRNAIDVRSYKKNPLDAKGTIYKKWYLSLPKKTLGTNDLIQSGAAVEIKQRTVEKYIREEEYFENTGHGKYKRKL
ncbi:MAG: hypothetical protein CL868_05840 [Cytophagaceae bacterium]|nr:hypothetical protein [Cytophagaceae bacterium]